MGIRSIIEKAIAKKEKYKAMEEDYRLQKMLEDRQKSANERELESYAKEQREKQIKQQLDSIRHQKKREAWTNNTMMRPQKNIFLGHKNILHSDNNAFLSRGNFI